MGYLLLVGLEGPEVSELRSRLRLPTLAFDNLPAIRVDRGRLVVEHPHFMGSFVPVDRVAFHGIFEDDFDFLAALALWNGPCLPSARGLMDCRLRLPGLVRALAVTRFGSMARGYAGPGSTASSDVEAVAKWGNWHCGEGKERFVGERPCFEPTLIEDFIDGEAVRIVLIGDRPWQVRMDGEGWLKSIHHGRAGFMPIDPDLLVDARRLGEHFGLEIVGVDYMVGRDGSRHLLEVNHAPNVTRFPEIREAYLDLVERWARPLEVG